MQIRTVGDPGASHGRRFGTDFVAEVPSLESHSHGGALHPGVSHRRHVLVRPAVGPEGGRAQREQLRDDEEEEEGQRRPRHGWRKRSGSVAGTRREGESGGL